MLRRRNMIQQGRKRVWQFSKSAISFLTCFIASSTSLDSLLSPLLESAADLSESNSDFLFFDLSSRFCASDALCSASEAAFAARPAFFLAESYSADAASSASFAFLYWSFCFAILVLKRSYVIWAFHSPASLFSSFT